MTGLFIIGHRVMSLEGRKFVNKSLQHFTTREEKQNNKILSTSTWKK